MNEGWDMATTDPMNEPYAWAADQLTARIVALGPLILTLTSPWQLFKIPGFQCCTDLEPTFAQATWALAKAQAILRERQTS